MSRKKKLVLKGLGAGGDDNSLTGSQGREEIGECLAGTGAGLDDEVTALLEGTLDGFGHLQLAGAVLVGEGRFGQQAARREELMEGGQGSG